MGKSQSVIPIAQVLGSGCSTGAAASAGSCASAASCSSGSSCSAGGAADANDPTVKLAAAGWVLRTTIGEPRLSEVVENYRAMGYEVHVEQFGTASADATASDGEACTTCFDTADRGNASQVWGSVYVRPGKPAAGPDELF